MKALLFAVALILPLFPAKAQQTISGTVTYFYKDSSYWVAAPAIVYLFDSRTTDQAILRLLDAKVYAEIGEEGPSDHRRYGHWMPLGPNELRGDDKPPGDSQLKAEKVKDSLRQVRKIKDSLRHILLQKERDHLEQQAYEATSPFFSDPHAKQVRVDSAGRYSFAIERPGIYYLLIRPMDEQAKLAGYLAGHKCYLKKILVDKGDQKDVSIILEQR